MSTDFARFFVDSNILIYAHDKDETGKHEKAKEFVLKKLESNNFFLSSQILAEFYLNATEKIQKPISIEDARKIIRDFSEATGIVNYSASTILKAAELNEMHKVHFWDALIAATMIENNVSTIFTENIKDFKKIRGIIAINPLE